MKIFIDKNGKKYGFNDEDVARHIREGFIECLPKEDGTFYDDYNLDGTPNLDYKPTIEVPQSITPRQARLILLKYGLLDDIEAILSTDRAMQIWWEYSLDVKRNNEHIINAGIALKLTDEQLDMMFIEGSKL